MISSSRALGALSRVRYSARAFVSSASLSSVRVGALLLLFVCFGLALPLFAEDGGKATTEAVATSQSAAAAETAQAMTGEALAEKIANQSEISTTYAAVEIELIDAAGNSGYLRLKQYSKIYSGSEKGAKKNGVSLIEFVDPASVKGTRFLVRGNSQWVYLPALKKVRRVAAGDRDSSFMGTDFSYGDMDFDKKTEDYTYTILREEKLFGSDCYVLETLAKDPDKAQYDKTISWVDKVSYLPRKSELYRKGEHLKTVTIERIEKVQGHYTPIVTTMKTEKTGHQTVLTIKGFVYDKKLPDALFSKKYLQTGVL